MVKLVVKLFVDCNFPNREFNRKFYNSFFFFISVLLPFSLLHYICAEPDDPMAALSLAWTSLIFLGSHREDEAASWAQQLVFFSSFKKHLVKTTSFCQGNCFVYLDKTTPFGQEKRAKEALQHIETLPPESKW